MPPSRAGRFGIISPQAKQCRQATCLDVVRRVAYFSAPSRPLPSHLTWACDRFAVRSRRSCSSRDGDARRTERCTCENLDSGPRWRPRYFRRAVAECVVGNEAARFKTATAIRRCRPRLCNRCNRITRRRNTRSRARANNAAAFADYAVASGGVYPLRVRQWPPKTSPLFPAFSLVTAARQT